jgi:hypothetical protein
MKIRGTCINPCFLTSELIGNSTHYPLDMWMGGPLNRCGTRTPRTRSSSPDSVTMSTELSRLPQLLRVQFNEPASTLFAERHEIRTHDSGKSHLQKNGAVPRPHFCLPCRPPFSRHLQPLSYRTQICKRLWCYLYLAPI